MAHTTFSNYRRTLTIIDQLRAGGLPSDPTKDQLWEYLIDLVWNEHERNVTHLWNRLQQLEGAYSTKVFGTLPFYFRNIRWRSMMLHGKLREVFDETASTTLNRSDGERINLRINLALHLGLECTAHDIWCLQGGSIDSYSKKNIPSYIASLEAVAARCNVRLTEKLRESLGSNNRLRDDQVYIGVRKANVERIVTSSSESHGVISSVIPGFFELPQRLPIKLLELNDISETFATWFSHLLRDSANHLRDTNSVPRIGEGWISETELFNKLQREYPSVKAVHHGRPSWLGRQHFDIWLPDLKLGIEYHGAQHFKPVAFFGGDEGFMKTQERDKKKLSLARRNGVQVIVITEEMSGDEISALLDGILSKKSKQLKAND